MPHSLGRFPVVDQHSHHLVSRKCCERLAVFRPGGWALPSYKTGNSCYLWGTERIGKRPRELTSGRLLICYSPRCGRTTGFDSSTNAFAIHSLCPACAGFALRLQLPMNQGCRSPRPALTQRCRALQGAAAMGSQQRGLCRDCYRTVPLHCATTTIERVVGDLNVGRCVGIEIFNNTENMTLENPRTYCESGNVWLEPSPEIPPGCSGNSVFVKKGSTACGSVGVLSYESDAFTLAIMFSNPFDYNLYSITFALQLCSGRQHFDSMKSLYRYMYGGGPPFRCNSFRKAELQGWNPGDLRVRNQEIEVKATMTSNYKSYLKVQIEQKYSEPALAMHSAQGNAPL